MLTGEENGQMDEELWEKLLEGHCAQNRHWFKSEYHCLDSLQWPTTDLPIFSVAEFWAATLTRW